MRIGILACFALVVGVVPAAGQQSEAELRAAIAAAEENATPVTLIQAGAAARLLGDYEASAEFLRRAEQSLQGAQNAVLGNQILLALQSGEGVNGAQRAFRNARRQRRLTPVQIANLTNNFPVLLTGGEFDELIGRMSADASDPEYQCACFAQKAWMHRVAGRMDESRAYWDSLVTSWERNPPQPTNPNARADVLAQWGRNYARAGRRELAREKLQESMAIEVSDAALPGVQRRWAQAYAELNDVESAVEHLELLLTQHTLVTVHSLEARATWAPVRSHPAFQAMLDRHR